MLPILSCDICLHLVRIVPNKSDNSDTMLPILRYDISLHLVRFVLIKSDNSDTMLPIFRCDISLHLVIFVLIKLDNSDTMLPILRCDISLHLVRFVLIGQFWHNVSYIPGRIKILISFNPTWNIAYIVSDLSELMTACKLNFDSCFGILVTISAFVPIARCKVSELDYN